MCEHTVIRAEIPHTRSNSMRGCNRSMSTIEAARSMQSGEPSTCVVGGCDMAHMAHSLGCFSPSVSTIIRGASVECRRGDANHSYNITMSSKIVHTIICALLVVILTPTDADARRTPAAINTILNSHTLQPTHDAAFSTHTDTEEFIASNFVELTHELPHRTIKNKKKERDNGREGERRRGGAGCLVDKRMIADGWCLFHLPLSPSGRCPRYYVFDSLDEKCKCPTGTAGGPRLGPVDATLHEHATYDDRCCHALHLPHDCMVPCCFCIETVVPYFHPHDCVGETALRQAAWWRRKNLERQHSVRLVEELKAKLEQAKREHRIGGGAAEEEHAHASAPPAAHAAASPSVPSPASTPIASFPHAAHPLSAGSSSSSSSSTPHGSAPSAMTSATSPSSPLVTTKGAATPVPTNQHTHMTGKSEAQVNNDVKSLFISSLIHR